MKKLVVVSDATPLIALAKINLLHRLPQLFDTIYIPRAVYDEVTVHGKDRHGSDEIRNAPWAVVKDVQDKTKLTHLLTILDLGEAEAIVLAEQLEANILLVDERKARNIAQALDLTIIGTVGLLTIFKQKGYIQTVQAVLDELINQDFRISQRVYDQILIQVGEVKQD